MSDRHYALFANNQHPLQLEAYTAYNNYLANLHDKKESETSEDMAARIIEIAEERSSMLNQAEGESLSLDDVSEIYM